MAHYHVNIQNCPISRPKIQILFHLIIILDPARPSEDQVRTKFSWYGHMGKMAEDRWPKNIWQHVPLDRRKSERT